MRDLIGKSFPIADRLYRIVDVRQVAGDALVYAEPLLRGEEQQGEGQQGEGQQGEGQVESKQPEHQRGLLLGVGRSAGASPARSARAAFHYRDIAMHLQSPK